MLLTLQELGPLQKTYNDDFARYISFRELERLLMCDPFGVKLVVMVLCMYLVLTLT